MADILFKYGKLFKTSYAVKKYGPLISHIWIPLHLNFL